MGFRMPQLRSLGRIGPPSPPRIMERAPHEDAGALVSDLIGDAQAAGEDISSVLDMPAQAVNLPKLPHRLLSGALDTVANRAKEIIRSVTGG